MIEIRKLPSSTEIASQAALIAANEFKKSLENHQLATFVMAGGRLPPLALSILAEKYANDFDWKHVLFLIGDERCVPLNDTDSSWLSALAMFNAHPEIPEENKLRPQSQLSAELAAEAYTKTLLTLPQSKSGIPIIDHLWLGIGEDGHTLSLFPNHPSSAGSTDELVIPVHNAPKLPPDRISFTYKALSGVESAVVFISGSGKAPVMAQIAKGDHSLPIVVASQTIEQAGGHVIWLVDEEAIALIPSDQGLNL